MSKFALEDLFHNRKDIEIERAAREVQADIWHRRAQLWKGNQPSDPINYLEPGVALCSLGYELLQVSSIGEILVNGERYEVAGEINNRNKTVKISDRHFAQDQRYTLAHELAHAVRHPEMDVMHRDLPFGKSGVVTDPREIEANRFASAYLMPWRLMLEQFEYCFGVPKIRLTERLAQGLWGNDVRDVHRQCRSPRQISLHIARATRFGRTQLRPLASQFQVSPMVMAIRLEELGLFTSRG